MEHEGKALAADEIDAEHRRTPGVASVHVRALLTWCAIFPMAAIGMTIMASFTQDWLPVLRALVLTLVVVPLAVYVVVPRFLLLHSRASAARFARAERRKSATAS